MGKLTLSLMSSTRESLQVFWEHRGGPSHSLGVGLVVVREGSLWKMLSKQTPKRISRINQNMSSVTWDKLKRIRWFIRVLQRKRTKRMCTYVYREVYFKELAHRMVQAG